MKNVFKKVGKSALALSILANTFTPLAVMADPEPDTYQLVIELEKNAKQFYGLDDNDGNKISYSVLGADPAITGDILLKKESNSQPGVFDQDVEGIAAECTSQDRCVYTIPKGNDVKIDFDIHEVEIKKVEPNPERPNENDYLRIEGHETFNSSKNFVLTEPQDFDGNPTLVWSCGTAVCYHKFTGVSGTSFVDASTVTDDRDSSKKFDVNAQTKGFVPTIRFESKKSAIDAGELAIDKIIGPDGIDYPPVGEPQENNAYVSYGDRAFKMIIYNEDYRGLTLGSLNDLAYYPYDWANVFERRENYDISGTTKENPTEVLALLLQKTININKLNYNLFNIDSIEPLDVPEGAVEVEPVTSGEKAGSYNITFNSNYFNKVVFKATDSSNNEYYFMVNRRTIDPYIDVNPNTGEGKIITEVFYDNHYGHDDFEVIAKIVYKDGTSKVVRQTAIPYGDAKIMGFEEGLEFDDENPPDSGVPQTDRGRGIKRTKYAYTTTRDELKKVDKIYINVEHAGSSNTFYSGNFSGSGKGDVLDMKYWEDRLN